VKFGFESVADEVAGTPVFDTVKAVEKLTVWVTVVTVTTGVPRTHTGAVVTVATPVFAPQVTTPAVNAV
jgi:hypothetical protein